MQGMWLSAWSMSWGSLFSDTLRRSQLAELLTWRCILGALDTKTCHVGRSVLVCNRGAGRRILSRLCRCTASELVMIGDRYLTDVVYGNRNGMLTIRPAPLTLQGEPITVKLVRTSLHLLQRRSALSQAALEN